METFNGKFKHKCSYCGGWAEEGWKDGGDYNSTLHLEDKDSGEERDLCIRCLIKIADKTLGKK